MSITDTLTKPSKSIHGWFEKAMPKPTAKNFQVQLGCHFEEVAEMLSNRIFDECHEAQVTLYALIDLANLLKKAENQIVVLPVRMDDRLELLDSIADQVVTAIGVGHTSGMDADRGLTEVNRSNWSKFVDGKPVFFATGKIAKGKDYSPPDLTMFV